MVESNRQVQISDPYERFDEAINDPRLYPAPTISASRIETDSSRCRTTGCRCFFPITTSNMRKTYDDPPQYTFGSKQPRSYTGRIVSGVIAASAAAAIARPLHDGLRRAASSSMRRHRLQASHRSRSADRRRRRSGGTTGRAAAGTAAATRRAAGSIRTADRRARRAGRLSQPTVRAIAGQCGGCAGFDAQVR